MQVWNVLRAARWKYSTQKIATKSPSGHHPTTLSTYVFATKACIDDQKKKLLSSNISSTCPMMNFGPLAAEICWRVWGIPANFNGFCILAALLLGIPVLGISQTLRHWTEGAHSSSSYLYQSLTFQNVDLLRFQAGGRRRRPNLGLVCLCWFCVTCIF